MEQQRIDEMRARHAATSPGDWTDDELKLETSRIRPDAIFICHAHQDVPNLINALEETMAESERLRDIFKKAEWSEIFDVAGDPFIGCRWCHGAKPVHYGGCPFNELPEEEDHELET